MKVKVYLLASGKYVVGKEGKEFIEDVVAINIGQSENGMVVSLYPFGFPFNQSLTDQYLNFTDSIWQIDADEHLAANYLKELTGIEIVPPMQSMDAIRNLQGLGINTPPKNPSGGGGLRLVRP